MKRPLRRICALGLAGAALLALLASPALARTEDLRWQHPDASTVAGFKVYVGASPGSYNQTFDVGLPLSGSVYTHALSVANGAAVYIAVTAYDASGLESAYSNEAFRQAPLGQPGQPVVVGN